VVDLVGRGVPAAAAQFAQDHEALRSHALSARSQKRDQVLILVGVPVEIQH
jgi:triosephosphate isomerase